MEAAWPIAKHTERFSEASAVAATDHTRSGAEDRARTTVVALQTAARNGTSDVLAERKHARRLAGLTTPRTTDQGQSASRNHWAQIDAVPAPLVGHPSRCDPGRGHGHYCGGMTVQVAPGSGDVSAIRRGLPHANLAGIPCITRVHPVVYSTVPRARSMAMESPPLQSRDDSSTMTGDQGRTGASQDEGRGRRPIGGGWVLGRWA
jgi:hypothetical protein